MARHDGLQPRRRLLLRLQRRRLQAVGREGADARGADRRMRSGRWGGP